MKRAVRWDESATAKLKSSGLTLKDAEVLGITYLTRDETAALCESFERFRSLRLDYFDHAGKPAFDWPGVKTPFYRIRYLEEPQGFESMTEQKAQRYAQPPNTAPVAYFPRNVDWTKLVKDPSKPIVVTEGELKAAKACREGFPTIGLGGVYNWRSHKNGISFLPSLEVVDWVRRAVYICFDSDARGNAMVRSALRELADELQRRGALVYFVALPELKGLKKVGLDDFLVHAPSAVEQMTDLLHRAEPLGLTAALWEINKRYVYVRDPGLVYNLHTRAKVSPTAFKEHVESTASYQEGEFNGEKVSYESVPASQAWLRWPLRGEVGRLTYKPGQPERVGDEHNIWPGWGVEPAPKPKGKGRRAERPDAWDRLLTHLFKGAEPEARGWFEQWCAYPLQYPGTKLFTTAVFHGIKHGTGKSFVGYTLGRIYGRNFAEISEMDLHNHFNEWAEAKQFVLGDDVTGPNKRADADFLKKLITQRELRVNAKYMPTYVVPDCVNYFLTSNHPDSFFIEDDDRRFFVHEVVVSGLDEQFYKEYELWLDSGGASQLFRYLLDVDTSTFNPSAPAMRTAAKERMTATVRSDLASWVRQMAAAPDQVLRVGDIVVDKDLFTSQELLEFYDPDRRTGTTANGLGRELARAGVRQVMDGMPVRLSDGRQLRLYAVRNADRWLAQRRTDAMAKHLEQWLADRASGDDRPKKKY
jgi:hypothetical protein